MTDGRVGTDRTGRVGGQDGREPSRGGGHRVHRDRHGTPHEYRTRTPSDRGDEVTDGRISSGRTNSGEDYGSRRRVPPSGRRREATDGKGCPTKQSHDYRGVDLLLWEFPRVHLN